MIKNNRFPPHSGYADKGLKSAKNKAINDLYEVERQLGMEPIPYNSTAWSEADDYK